MRSGHSALFILTKRGFGFSGGWRRAEHTMFCIVTNIQIEIISIPDVLCVALHNVVYMLCMTQPMCHIHTPQNFTLLHYKCRSRRRRNDSYYRREYEKEGKRKEEGAAAVLTHRYVYDNRCGRSCGAHLCTICTK